MLNDTIITFTDYNNLLKNDNPSCEGIVFSHKMREKYMDNGGNCFLKSSLDGMAANEDWTMVELLT